MSDETNQPEVTTAEAKTEASEPKTEAPASKRTRRSKADLAVAEVVGVLQATLSGVGSEKKRAAIEEASKVIRKWV